MSLSFLLVLFATNGLTFFPFCGLVASSHTRTGATVFLLIASRMMCPVKRKLIAVAHAYTGSATFFFLICIWKKKHRKLFARLYNM